LYETFPAEEAKRLRDKLEVHYTPKHGSWLNMAEIELSVINNQGLPARIGTLKEKRREFGHGTKYGMGKAVRSPGGLRLPMPG
jgi:hypothetical protein